MDEVDSSKIHENQPVRVTLDPFPDQECGGHVRHIAPYVLDIEEQNRTVEIEVELDDPAFAATLLPGTSADVEVILSVKEEVLHIPPSTLFEGQNVFVVEKNMLSIRSVEIGMKNWDFVEVLSGVSEHDQVVTSLDEEGLEEGLPVVIRSSPGKS